MYRMGAQRTEELRKNKTGLSLQHLLQYADKGEDMLNRITTEYKSWVHHYQPESSILQCNGNIPVLIQPKRLRL
jgi:hypothetical protein